ncbi:hypothetical protein NN3_08210 [Nocardia neocaledoniensis NBRC 108232]|uniref:Uncharacterized protein DUF3558 n=1 Tax=Nocardia neocaledoniensis TaxID=236511 RepID=A0A317NUQ5_9NOCA|nr:DUF3558 domain-containing protein [Nocardia neocaledoniensis]PWV78044.1 uncharacterized protein DUF3558 [Nocardia neocaledoniensis]GEM29814.1 hypothetical protein NN3_08210 [Nocardia neocaledoniensis NBRC 108232]
MRLIGLAVGACAVLVLAGCSEEGGGQAEVSGAPLTKEQLFDPCTVPEGALVAAGADPASKDDNPFTVGREDWKGCDWSAGGHYIGLISTTHTLDEFRANDRFSEFRDVTIGDRRALQHYVGSQTPPNECQVTFDTSRGRVSVSAMRFLSDKSTTDPCEWAAAAAPHFMAYLPQ